MTLSEHLNDLLGHQEWADARLWNALSQHPGALADGDLRTRLHHIALVQRVFLAVVQQLPLEISDASEFADDHALLRYMAGSHSGIRKYLQESPPDLQRTITMPFLREPGLDLEVGQALFQMIMHSQWHRGQNAARLRQLGGSPPVLDYIIWILQDKPAAEWPDH